MTFEHGLSLGDSIDNVQLMDIFKCSNSGGMRRSHRTNSLVIISDHNKSIYEDRWVSDDRIHYTGMGLVGDQSLEYAQNKTLNKHQDNGVVPYLFEVFDSGNYLFRGQLELSDKPFEDVQPDKNGDLRKVWIFPLEIVSGDSKYQVPKDLLSKKQKKKEKAARKLSDQELAKRATHSNKHPVNRKVSSSAYERNVYVAELAKRKANGICQLCNESAPFNKRNGEPFLETHHVVWLSNGGEDSIENTVALCPNCHRKMHILNLNPDIKKLKR